MRVAFDTTPGTADRPNEDWVAATPDTVIVLDGVTAPRVADPACHHPVPWFVDQLGTALLESLRGTTLPAGLADAIDRVNTRHGRGCDLSGQGTPAAAVAILRRLGDIVEYLVLADTTVVLDTMDGITAVTDSRVDEAAPVELAATRTEAIGTPRHARAVALMSVAQLSARNRPGGYWVAATNPEAAHHAITGQVPASLVRRAAVLTDGASRIVDTFGEMDWPACLNFLQCHGPRALIQRVRQVEARDPDGRRWPRFKRSDDATAVLVEP